MLHGYGMPKQNDGRDITPTVGLSAGASGGVHQQVSVTPHKVGCRGGSLCVGGGVVILLA